MLYKILSSLTKNGDQKPVERKSFQDLMEAVDELVPKMTFCL